MIDYALAPLKKYMQFSGRSRRAEFWWYCLAVFIVNAVLATVEGAMGMRTQLAGGMSANGPLTGLLALALLIPNLAVCFRRLHDTNRSAWWMLLSFLPVIGWIWLLVLFVQAGTAGPNRFGEDPKAAPGAEPAA